MLQFVSEDKEYYWWHYLIQMTDCSSSRHIVRHIFKRKLLRSRHCDRYLSVWECVFVLNRPFKMSKLLLVRHNLLPGNSHRLRRQSHLQPLSLCKTWTSRLFMSPDCLHYWFFHINSSSSFSIFFSLKSKTWFHSVRFLSTRRCQNDLVTLNLGVLYIELYFVIIESTASN